MATAATVMNPCGGARGETWWLTGSRREVAVCSGRRGASGIDGDRRRRPEEGEEDGGGVEASQLVSFGVVDVVDGGEPFGHGGRGIERRGGELSGKLAAGAIE